MCNCKELKKGEKLPRNEDSTSLRPCVAKEYEVVGVEVGIIIWRNYKIDLSQICLLKAAQLIEEGFKYLRKKEVVENDFKGF